MFMCLQRADSSDEHQKIVSDVHIIDFTKQSLSISESTATNRFIIVFNNSNYFLDVTVSSGLDLEQLHIKSSDVNIPTPLAHDYVLSAATSDDIKQWYRALQESKLLDNSTVNCRKRSPIGSTSKEVCVLLLLSDNLFTILSFPIATE